ncbi:MAG: glycosyltransferase family A protein, partial [Longicatena sp.]
MELVTVITPTYNRASKLPILFKSLLAQSSRNFLWLIVDDGSTDNTEKVVHEFKKEALFSIVFLKKENGGKHTALNVGIREIYTELTMIVDSDDILLPNAIRIIEQSHVKYKYDKSIGAFSYVRIYPNGKPILPIEKDEETASYIKYRIKDNRPGDMAEVFYSKVLKEFPFVMFDEEKFLSEDVVWIQIGKRYSFVFINKPIYQCEYFDDGLTANDKKVKFNSPLGSMMRGKMLMSKECGMKVNIKGAIIYNCYKLEVQ